MPAHVPRGQGDDLPAIVYAQHIQLSIVLIIPPPGAIPLPGAEGNTAGQGLPGVGKPGVATVFEEAGSGDMSHFPSSLKMPGVHEVSGDSPDAVNSCTRPDAVSVRNAKREVDGEHVDIAFSPHSFTVLEMQLALPKTATRAAPLRPRAGW